MTVAGMSRGDDPGFFITRNIDDAGEGYVPEPEEEEAIADDWENPAEAIRENLRTEPYQPDPDEIARRAAEQVARKFGYEDEPDEASQLEAFKQEIAAQIMHQVQASIGELAKPQLVSSISESVCKGLAPEVKEKLEARLAGFGAAALQSARNNPEAMQEFRALALGYSQTMGKKRVSAPMSEGAGSTKTTSIAGDPAFEEWYRRVGGPELGLDRDKGAAKFIALQGGRK